MKMRVVLALEAMAFGRLVDTGLVATLPGAIGDLSLRLRRVGARMDTNAVEKLGIDTHQS